MGFRAFALTVATLAFILATNCIPVRAQVNSPASKSEIFSISLAMEKSHVLTGQKSMADLVITNINNVDTCSLVSNSVYRVHIERDGVEPPKTESHRHLLGDYRPGDGPQLPDGPTVCGVPAQSPYVREFDLGAYYDLSIPGKYSVYLEVVDRYDPATKAAHWLRTNTAPFEISTPSQ